MMKYNPMFPDISSFLKKQIPLLYTLQDLISSMFKRNQSFKELLGPSLYLNKNIVEPNSVTSCNKCDIHKNYLICSNYFTCTHQQKMLQMGFPSL